MTNEQCGSKIVLRVNGEPVKLNGFVSRMIIETTLGMLRALQGIGDVKTVSLEIKQA